MDENTFAYIYISVCVYSSAGYVNVENFGSVPMPMGSQSLAH